MVQISYVKHLFELEIQQDKGIIGTVMNKFANYVALCSYHTLINKESNHFTTDSSHKRNKQLQGLKTNQ